MGSTGYHFFPLMPVFLAALGLLLAIAIGLIEFHLLAFTYEKMGIRRQYVYGLLLLCLLGSYVNIPIARLPPEPVVSGVDVWFFGVQYVVPVVTDWQQTILAVNVGGALIPTALAMYLLIRNRLYAQGFVGTVIVALLVHMMARPLPGVGIAVPTLIPPVLAAVTALLMTREKAAPLAYIVGTLGTLVGADLMNLGRIQGLGAPVASIGGAGTFDGVFLTGILAVLLA